jgi:predicted AlkP superfamily phosphohydrolase/phosphomutase
MERKPWDFFMVVDMGVDRLHHGFWRYCDPGHPKFEEGNDWRWVIRDYYEALDGRIGELLDIAGPETKVMVVSDHGAKAIHGGIRINQWLMEQGYLVMKSDLGAVKPFRIEDVEWSLTTAWGSAGYCGRVHLNVRGREGEGIVAPEDVDGLKGELRERLVGMRGPSGAILGNEVFFPEELYPVVNGIAPDLMVYFGGLHWRSLGELGGKSDGERVFAEGNDTGPDDANHAMEGLVIMRDGIVSERTDLEGENLIDVAPTILDWMGVAVPESMQGRVLGL